MSRILFLSTWFPYPLSQGSQIRAYHLLRALAECHDVALVAFAGTQIERASLDHMRQFCCEMKIVQHDPFVASPLRRRLGWLSPQPSSVVASHSSEMAAKVRSITKGWRPDSIVALTFITAPYALQGTGVPKIVDADICLTRVFHEAYEQAEGLAMRMRRWLAWRKFRRYEGWLFGQFELCLVVSDRERQGLLAAMSNHKSRVGVVSNGVDTQYNRFGLDIPQANTLVFNGALTYQANFDAMDYFLKEIFPLVLAEAPDVRLRITGRTDNVPLARLRLNDRVDLTGYLKDVRPTVAGSWACVVPLRTGGGTRVKILEAMALGTPVISTTKGAEGLEVEAEKHLLIADTPREFASQTIRLLREPQLRTILTCNARRLVDEKYNWAEIGRQFRSFVEDTTSATRAWRL